MINAKSGEPVNEKGTATQNSAGRPAVALITAHGWIGISNPVIHTARFLAENGYRVDIFMSTDAACERMGIADPGLAHDHIHVHTHAGQASPLETTAVCGDVQVPLNDIEFVDACRQNPGDYQWLVGFDPGGLNRAGLLSLIWNRPYIYHSLELYEAGWPGKAAERWFADKARLVLTQDETRADILAEIDRIERGKVLVARNSAPGPATPERKDYFYRILAIPPDKKIVLAAGTLLPIHGVDEIVASVAGWPEACVLVLHGWIPDRDFERTLRKQVADCEGRIFLSTAIVDQEHKNDIFQSADVGLVFFRPEGVNYKYAAGSSGKLYDFMRAGVPIIGNDIPGMQALVAGNGCGRVVPDAAAIGPVLPEILARHDHFRQNALKAFEQYEFGHCYRSVLDRIIKEVDRPPVAAEAAADSGEPQRPDKFSNPADGVLRADDILIASFPRSGNTWTRNLIVDIILQLQGTDTTTNMFDDVEKIIPDIYQTRLAEGAADNPLPFRLVKTHARFNPDVKKTIYVFRRPVDVLSSYCHYRIDFENMPATDDIDGFSRKNLGDWYKHVDSYVAAGADHPDEILFVSYEWLHRDTAGALMEMAAFLGLPATPAMCTRAVENQQFQKHRRQSRQFYRKGVVGGGKQELKAETVAYIEQRSDPLYAAAAALTRETGPDEDSPSAAPASVRVATLSVHDSGGAGKAAARLHAGLRQKDLEAVMLVASRYGNGPGIRVLREADTGTVQPSARRATHHSSLWEAQYRAWGQQLEAYPDRPAGLEMFTDTRSAYRLDLVEEILSADVVHLHWVAGVVDPAALYRAIGGKPVIWTLHDMNPFTGGCHYAGDCRRYEQSCGDCPQLGSAGEDDLSRRVWTAKAEAYRQLNLTIVTPSHWLAGCAGRSSLFRDRPIRVIPNGFPLEVFKPGDTEQVRRELDIPPDALVVLFGADSVLNRRKGFRYLLEALRQLAEAADECELVLACFGHLPEDAAVHPPCRLIKMGNIKDEAHLARAYSAADVFVLPSLEDNLPNTVIEALACGVPVVAFNSGGIREIIDHGKTGCLVDRRHPDDLAAGIARVLTSGEFGRLASDRCRRKAIDSYAIDARADDYVRLYRQVLAGDARGSLSPAAGPADGRLEDLAGQIQAKLADLAQNPGDIPTLLALGGLSIKAGRPEEAGIFYARVLDSDPLNPEARTYCDDLYGFKPGELMQDLKATGPEQILVSAIVSTFNARRFIRGCLEDLEAQTLADRLEIIVVDSGSGQDERVVVEQMQKQYDNIVYIRTEERDTVYGAWNRGIRAARGRYITNANTDDRHSPDALERLVHFLETHPDVALVYADAVKTRTANETLGAHTPTGAFHWHDWDREALLAKGCFIGPQPMWRRSVHDTYGFFDAELVSSGDYEFWLRISQTESFFHLKMPLGLYLDREDSIEHASTAIKATEDERILTMYRQAAADGRILRKKAGIAQPEVPGEVDPATTTGTNGSAAEAATEQGENTMTQSDPAPHSPETEAALIAYMEEKLQGQVDAAVIHNDLGIMYCRTGDHQKALENFTAATDRDPENSTYLKNLADFHYSVLKDSRAALTVYKKLLTLDPVDITILTILGHIHLGGNEFGEAKVYYQRILDLDPGNTEILGYLEKLGAQPQEAADAKPSDSAETLYEKVQLLVEKNDDQGACGQLENLVTAYPDYALAHNDLGVLYYKAGRKEKALAAYERAVALEPENLTFKKNLADFKCVELRQFEEAVGLYNEILAARPDDLETLTALGQVCAMLGKDEDARHFFNQALAVEPWNAELRQLLEALEQGPGPSAAGESAQEMHAEAKALAEAGKPDEARSRLGELVAAYPELAVGHNDLGVMAYQAGDKEAARQHYEKAVELEPDNAVFRKNLADFYCVEQGRVEEAMQIYVDLLAQAPDDVEILTTLGQVCEQLDQTEDALRFYENALNVEPWNADIRQRMEDLKK
jgi:glycosyltransferase involved in cell wall biosynthesis/Flp pilus assembly protein TadD